MKKAVAALFCLSLLLVAVPLHSLAGDADPVRVTVAGVENGEILIDGSSENDIVREFPRGTEITLEIIPGSGYEIDGISIGDQSYEADHEIGDRGASFQRELVLEGDLAIAARFRPVRHTIRTAAGEHGSLAPENPAVEHGQDITFTITPAPGYRIELLLLDGEQRPAGGDNQFTIHHVERDMALEVFFREVETHIITTTAGPNGRITPENPRVEHDGEITFTIEPDAGFIIDELSVEGRPEMPEGDNTFTLFRVQRDMELSVTFMESVLHAITVAPLAGGSVAVLGEGGEPGPVPEAGTRIERSTRTVVSYFIRPAPGYSLAGVFQVGGPTENEELGFFVYYDQAAGELRLDVETEFDHTLFFQFIPLSSSLFQDHCEDIVILREEAGGADAIRGAVRREYALRGMLLDLEDIAVGPLQESISSNGVAYGIVPLELSGGAGRTARIRAYLVDDVTNLVFVIDARMDAQGVTPDPGNSGVYITHGLDPFGFDLSFQVPGFTRAYWEVYGAYGTMLASMDEQSRNAFRPCTGAGGALLSYRKWVPDPFYRAQFHVMNNGFHCDKGLSWFNFVLIQENALCLSIGCPPEQDFQETFTWNIDKLPHLSAGDALQQIYFGNRKILLQKPAGGMGNIESMTAAASGCPGYTFTNNDDGTVTVEFLSDFYDEVVVPLTIDLKSGGTVRRNLTLHRVGVDIQAHDRDDGNPARRRVVWHGTQNGNQVDLGDGNGFKITAAYYLPDGGSTRPYGLYVTRKYADGSVETEMITEPLRSPHPSMEDLYDYSAGVFIYRNDHTNWANCADYLIYAGPDSGTAPVEVAVLVLKDPPVMGDSFGGIDFGSGAGVRWTRS